MHLRKFQQFLFRTSFEIVKIAENLANRCQVMNSRPLIEGLSVIFPPFSDFQGHIYWF